MGKRVNIFGYVVLDTMDVFVCIRLLLEGCDIVVHFDVHIDLVVVYAYEYYQ